MTTAARALLHADLSPCYLGCDVQTTGMAWAALSLDDGTVIGTDWLPFARGQQIEYEAARAVGRMACDLDAMDVRPVQVAVERVGGGRGVQSMLAVANAAGIVAGMVAMRFDTAGLWRPTPSEWKRLCGLSGNAGKAAVTERARIIAGPLVDDARQDIMDAVCIAWADRQAGIHAVGEAG